MTASVPRSCRRALIALLALAGALTVGAGLTGGTVAQATPRQPTQIARITVAAPCASQGSCKYCGRGGIWTGNCTRAKLEYNVAWCGRNKAHLSSYNKAKCKAEAGYLGSGPADQLLPWINVVCAPPNARTIYLVVKGMVEKAGLVGVACAGISVYAGLHSLLFEIF